MTRQLHLDTLPIAVALTGVIIYSSTQSWAEDVIPVEGVSVRVDRADDTRVQAPTQALLDRRSRLRS